MRSLPWDTIFQDKIASVWTFHRLRILQEIPACSTMESVMACSMDSAPLCELQGSTYSGICSTFSTSFSDLCVHHSTEFFSLLLCLGGAFLFFKYIHRSATRLTCLLWQVCCRTRWKWLELSVSGREQTQPILTKATSEAQHHQYLGCPVQKLLLKFG